MRIRLIPCESVRIRANPTGRAVTGRRHVRDITGVTQCTVQKMSKVPSIKLRNSNEKSSWMIPCTVQSEKVDALTRWPWRWPRMTLYHIYLKSIWKIKLNDTLHSSIWKSWVFDLMTLKMTSDHGKSYISGNYMKNRVEWHSAQLNLIKLKNQPPAPFIILHRPPKW